MKGNQDSPSKAAELADFLMLAQRSFLLDLADDLHEGNISYAQFFLMGFLDKSESLTMSEIAGKMSHSTAAATGLVDRLERLGYVMRFNDPSDRRKVKVKITPDGSRIVAEVHQKLEERVASMMEEKEVTPELAGLLRS